MISVIIPISIDDFNKGNLIIQEPFLKRTKDLCTEEIEILPILNRPSMGRVKSKNYGASIAHGETLVFLDSDCYPSANFLNEVSRKSKNDYFAGGGVKYVRLGRCSRGILTGMFFLALYLILRQITIGAFWIRREIFFEIGGFREKKFDDIDFALRLKKHAGSTGKKFESIKESFLIWSTRKFDRYGDWHWLKGYHIN